MSTVDAALSPPLLSQLLTPLAVDTNSSGDEDDCTSCDPARIRPLRSTSSRHRHRLEALSAVYLQRVTEMISTGELLPDLLDSRLAVSRVRGDCGLATLISWPIDSGASVSRVIPLWITSKTGFWGWTRHRKVNDFLLIFFWGDFFTPKPLHCTVILVKEWIFAEMASFS